MKVNYCGKAAQERMARNGWRLELPLHPNESPEEIYARLSQKHTVVRVYWHGTMIRGIHEYFAFVKG